MPTLVLVATELYPTRVIPPVPVGPPQPTGGPPDLGTVSVFSDVIRQKKAVVGEHSGTCVHVRAPNMWLCHAGWHLEDVDPDPPGGKEDDRHPGSGWAARLRRPSRVRRRDLRGNRRLRARGRRDTRQLRRPNNGVLGRVQDRPLVGGEPIDWPLASLDTVRDDPAGSLGREAPHPAVWLGRRERSRPSPSQRHTGQAMSQENVEVVRRVTDVMDAEGFGPRFRSFSRLPTLTWNGGKIPPGLAPATTEASNRSGR